jgi:3-hydroxybutyryl-CoA dehydrogenase
MKKLVGEGNLGAKTGKGLYEWTPEKLKKISKEREQVLVQWLKEDLKKNK